MQQAVFSRRGAPPLTDYISLALKEMKGQHVFPDPTKEPVFWGRHFKIWVADAIELDRYLNNP